VRLALRVVRHATHPIGIHPYAHGYLCVALFASAYLFGESAQVAELSVQLAA